MRADLCEVGQRVMHGGCEPPVVGSVQYLSFRVDEDGGLVPCAFVKWDGMVTQTSSPGAIGVNEEGFWHAVSSLEPVDIEALAHAAYERSKRLRTSEPLRMLDPTGQHDGEALYVSEVRR